MAERPILFSGAMVRAILEDRKLQTRRIAKPQPPDWTWSRVAEYARAQGLTQRVGNDDYWTKPCPYGQAGDQLWVKETHAFLSLDYRIGGEGVGTWHPSDRDVCCHYRDRCPPEIEQMVSAWRPSIFMPRWASRISLELTAVRVERLQDISEADAKAEGAEPMDVADITDERIEILDLPLIDRPSPYRMGYALLWESINGPGSWAANPWVWALSFRRV
jgi:hypothetical protein